MVGRLLDNITDVRVEGTLMAVTYLEAKVTLIKLSREYDDDLETLNQLVPTILTFDVATQGKGRR